MNRTPVRRKRDLRRQVRAVFFGPFDLESCSASPSKRRRFMDEALVALWPLKEALLTAYDRALRQRNRLLKEWDRGRARPPGIEAWDEELIQAGVAVIRARGEAVARLAPHASEEFAQLAGYELACDYAPNVTAAGADRGGGASATALAERRARRAAAAHHRSWARTATTSRWRCATSAPGASLATARRGRPRYVCGSASPRAVEAEIGEPPVLLVDDPFSALDPRRRDQVGERLAAAAGRS